MTMDVFRRGVFFMVPAMFSLCGCVHVKTFHVVGKLNVRLDELSPCRDTFIFVPEGGCSPLIAFPDPSGHGIADQLHQSIR